MSFRRREILNELGLSPQWCAKPNHLDNAALATPPENHPHNERDENSMSRRDRILGMDWQQLKQEVKNCTACCLCQTRTQTVFGVGDENADWLYIGESPGASEDALGEPFVGKAGQLLDNMLAALKLQRGHQVYITNIVKCRPPENRNPDASETKQCEPYLARQIELIKPKIIVALGKVAAQNLLGLNDNISNLRGKLHTYSGIPLIVTYHPAYLLHSLPDKAKAWEDLCFAKKTMQPFLE